MDKLTIDLSLESPTMTFSDVGIPGPRGFKGEKGDTGAPLRFTDLTPAQKLEIQGERGLQGIQGIKGDSIKGDKGDRGLQGIQGERFTYADFTPENKMELSQVAVDAVVPYVSQVASLKNDVTLAKATAVKSSEEAMDYNKNAQVAAQSATKDASEAISASSKVSTAYSDIKAIQVDVVAKASGVSQNALQVSTQASQIAVSATTVSSQAADVAIKAKAADASSKAAVDASAKAILAKESIDQKAVIIEGQYSGVVEKHNDVVSKHADVVAAQSQVASNTSSVTAMVSQASASADSASQSASSAANKATKTESDRVVTMAARDEAVAAAAKLTGALNYEGIYDASSGVYPTSKGRDSFWKVVVPGTIGTVQFKPGDQIEYRVSTNGYTRVPNSAPVLSVNGKEGAVTITAADVGALPSAWTPTWGDVKGKPTVFPPEAHKHAWGDLVGIPLVFASNWASVADKPTEFTPVVHQHSWKDLADKPSTFAPEAHSHTWDALGGKPSVFASEWAQVSNKPSVYPPDVHAHSWDTVTGKPSVFPTAWADVANPPIFATRWPKWSEVPEKPTVFPPEGHRHAWGDLTDVPSVFATNWASIANIPLNASRWPTAWEIGAAPDSIGFGANRLSTYMDADVIRAPGIYEVNASAGSVGFPGNYGTVLVVGSVVNASTYAKWMQQTYYSTDGVVWMRTSAAPNTFAGSQWVRVYDTLNKPTAAEIGALPITGQALNTTAVGVRKDVNSNARTLAFEMGPDGIGYISKDFNYNMMEFRDDGVNIKHGVLMEAGQRVFSPSNPPTAAQVGALPASTTLDTLGGLPKEQAGIVPSYLDINTFKTSGRFNIPGQNPNWAFNALGGGVLDVFVHGGTYVRQVAYFGGGNLIRVRSLVGTVWSPWAAIYSDYDRPSPADIGALPANGKAVDSALLAGLTPTPNIASNTVAVRDANGDINTRLFKSTYQSQSDIAAEASLCFRVNNTTDTYMRFAPLDAVRNWLGRVNDSAMLGGKTVDQVKSEARAGLAVDSITINNKRINANITLGAADMELGNVANFGNTSLWNGQSTTLYATQKAVYDAASAPALGDARKRVITYGTDAPAGVVEEGWVYIQY